MKSLVKKSFVVASSKPNDVHYRLKRAAQVLQQAEVFLNSIDPTAFGAPANWATMHEAREFVNKALLDVAHLQRIAPGKKARKTGAEKAHEAQLKREAKLLKLSEKENKAKLKEAIKSAGQELDRRSKKAAKAEKDAAWAAAQAADAIAVEVSA